MMKSYDLNKEKMILLTCRFDSRHLLAALGSWMFKATFLASWTIDGIASEKELQVVTKNY